MNATEFLTLLWTDKPSGLIQFWRLHDKRSYYLPIPDNATSLVDGEPDIYTAVALTHKDHGTHRRATARQTTALAGLWLDLDVDGGPDNKTGAIPTVGDALDLAQRIAPPTIVVSSGYGLHAWWLFEEPWTFAGFDDQDHAARMSAQWYKLHRAVCAEGGWGLDGTHDLARLLRLPGTVNAKGGQAAAVHVVECDGSRYDRAELAELCARAGEVPEARIGRATNVTAGGSLDEGMVDELCRRNGSFAKAWAHDRNGNWSMSEYDLALCSSAAKDGWDDEQLAALIAEHRRRHDPLDQKAFRGDYVQRTIDRARLEPEPEQSGQPDSDTFGAGRWADVLLTALQSSDAPAIPTPFRDITEGLDGGLRAGEVCIVAGYTSHGKSIVVDQFADTAAAAGKRVHLYMTEMTAVQRGLRLLARRAGIPMRDLKRRTLDASQYQLILAELEALPYGCSIVADWPVDQVVEHVRENRWDMAVVDLIHGFHYTDERDLSKTSSALVRAAKGWHPGTVVLAAAHLNDGQVRDQRSPVRPRPGLHSIKGTSSIKQDADVVMFVWRQDDTDGTPTMEGELWIAKNRDGGFAHTELLLDPARMRFITRVAA